MPQQNTASRGRRPSRILGHPLAFCATVAILLSAVAVAWVIHERRNARRASEAALYSFNFVIESGGVERQRVPIDARWPRPLAAGALLAALGEQLALAEPSSDPVIEIWSLYEPPPEQKAIGDGSIQMTSQISAYGRRYRLVYSKGAWAGSYIGADGAPIEGVDEIRAFSGDAADELVMDAQARVHAIIESSELVPQ